MSLKVFVLMLALANAAPQSDRFSDDQNQQQFDDDDRQQQQFDDGRQFDDRRQQQFDDRRPGFQGRLPPRTNFGFNTYERDYQVIM